MRRVHATMRSAFATAKRKRLISHNPCVDIELPRVDRRRVHPWSPEQLGTFLDYVNLHGEHPTLYEVLALTGLRRGEALGLRWQDLDLERGRLTVRQAVLQIDGEQPPCPTCGEQHRGAQFGKPKTASGEDRIVDLDQYLVGALIAHRLTQDVQRAQWAEAYNDHDLVFARPDGTPIAPERITKEFARLVTASGLPKIRLHDLRHGQASLMLAAGVPLQLVSKRLGPSSISLTSDLYSHLLDGVGRQAAEAATALVPRRDREAAPMA